MTKKIFNLSNREKAVHYRNNYSAWKKYSLDSKGYFIIFNGFLERRILKNITGNSLKLYIFLGIHSNNETGESYYSIESMAKYFGKSERTINNWINELEKLNLIKRMRLVIH